MKTFKSYLQYNIILLCSFVLLHVCVVGQDANSVYIYGDIGIHGEMVVYSDLYIDSAEVEGSGAIVLYSTNTDAILTHIFSNQSTIGHLIVQNPARTILHGDLTISEQLDVYTGVFDVRHATFDIESEATLFVAANALLLMPEDSLSTSPLWAAAIAPLLLYPVQHSYADRMYSTQQVLQQADAISDYLYSTSTQKSAFWKNQIKQTWIPPPQ